MRQGFHPLAFQQGRLSLQTLLDLDLQAVVSPQQRGVGRAERRHHQSGHEDQQPDPAVARDARREGFGDHPQIHRAEDVRPLLHRGGDHQAGALIEGRGSVALQRRLGPRTGVAGDEPAPGIVDSGGFDTGIGVQGGDIAVRRVVVVERKRRFNAVGQDGRLDGDIAKTLRLALLFVVGGHAQPGQDQAYRDNDGQHLGGRPSFPTPGPAQHPAPTPPTWRIRPG